MKQMTMMSIAEGVHQFEWIQVADTGHTNRYRLKANDTGRTELYEAWDRVRYLLIERANAMFLKTDRNGQDVESAYGFNEYDLSLRRMVMKYDINRQGSVDITFVKFWGGIHVGKLILDFVTDYEGLTTEELGYVKRLVEEATMYIGGRRAQGQLFKEGDSYGSHRESGHIEEL